MGGIWAFVLESPSPNCAFSRAVHFWVKASTVRRWRRGNLIKVVRKEGRKVLTNGAAPRAGRVGSVDLLFDCLFNFGFLKFGILDLDFGFGD